MTVRATVVLSSFASTGRATLESLDRQSLHVSEFDVVIVDDGTDPGVLQRVTQLVENRPNVRHVAVPGGASVGVRRNTGLAAARGAYVLVLDDDTTLGDETLSRLADHADETGADICLGRTSRPGVQSGTAGAFDENTSRTKADDVIAAFEAGRLYRRQFLEDAGLLRSSDESEALDDLGFGLEATSRTDAISVLATYPAFSRISPPSLTGAGNNVRSIAQSTVPDDLRDRALLAAHRRSLGVLLGSSRVGPELDGFHDIVNEFVPDRIDEQLPAPHQRLSAAVRTGDRALVERLASAAGPHPKVRNIATRWADQTLELTMDLEPTEPDSGPSGPRPAVGARVAFLRRVDGLEWQLPDADVRIDTVSAADTTRLTARLRPDHLAGGGWLDHGVWLATLVVSVGEVEHRLRVPRARKAPARVSYVDGVPVVCFSEDGRLGIDVGAVRQPVVSRLRPEGSQVVENALGSLLRVPVPNLDLPEGTEVSGHLRIGRLPVPARLTVEDGQPVLRAWVSGLAGRYPLATKFSAAPYARTGLALEIDPVGRMTTRRAAPKKAGGKRQPSAPTPATAVGRVKQVLKRVPGTERGYRRLRAAAGR